MFHVKPLERCLNCQRIRDHAISGTESPSGWLCTYCEWLIAGRSYVRHDEITIARLSAENAALRQAILQNIERDA